MLGGSQAASRSLQGLFTPETNSAEFFGFFAVSGKFASVFGPLIYGILIAITGSVQSGILSVLVFFLSEWRFCGRWMKRRDGGEAETGR